MHSIMSIDQSLSCSGITIWEDNQMVHSVCVKTPAKIEAIVRIRSIIADIATLVNTYNVKHIVIESLPYGSVSSSVRALAALYHCIQNYCLDNNVGFSEAHVTKVKKNFTGKGNAGKGDMLKVLETNYPRYYEVFSNQGYKKTTGLADLTDSFAIYQLYKQDKETT